MIDDVSELTSENPLKVLIVDDHPIVLSGCRSLLGPRRHIEMLEAATGETAWALFCERGPDVTVIDMNLPDACGLDLANRILGNAPDAKLIIMSMNDEPVYVQEALRRRIKDYVSKNGEPAALYDAIMEVARGGIWLPLDLARKLNTSQPGYEEAAAPVLSAREIEILTSLAKGTTMYEFAETMSVSYKTVANYCTAIREKLKARTALEMIAIAVERKLVER